jgi:hypothetical protein
MITYARARGNCTVNGRGQFSVPTSERSWNVSIPPTLKLIYLAPRYSAIIVISLSPAILIAKVVGDARRCQLGTVHVAY